MRIKQRLSFPSIGAFGVLGIAALTLLLSCGPGAGSDGEDDLYEYVTGWYIPDTNGVSTAELSATDSYVFVSVDNIASADRIYWYTSAGVLGTEVISNITTHSKIPSQVVGVCFYNGLLYVVDHSGNSVWSMNPSNPESSSQKIITYGTQFPLDAAVNSDGVYTTRRDGSLNWTVDLRDAGEVAPDYSYPLPGNADPQGIALDSSGSAYIADHEHEKVYNLSSTLGYIASWDLNTCGPYGVAVDGDDNVFVLDTTYCRVLVYATNGDRIGSFGSQGTGNGQFSSAVSISASPNGYVYVADYQYSSSGGRTRIQKFQKK